MSQAHSELRSHVVVQVVDDILTESRIISRSSRNDRSRSRHTQNENTSISLSQNRCIDHVIKSESEKWKVILTDKYCQLKRCLRRLIIRMPSFPPIDRFTLIAQLGEER